jgi:heme-degrading monooxygenase HmoA
MPSNMIPSAYRDAPHRVPKGVLPGGSVANVGEDEVVLFLIGARIHRWRKVRSWFPTFVAMPRMLVQLAKNPDLGLLHAKTYRAGRDVIVVQYWRSVEDLGRFAKDPALAHAPAWAAFNRVAAGTGDIGIWHETYRVPTDHTETRYGKHDTVRLG